VKKNGQKINRGGVVTEKSGKNLKRQRAPETVMKKLGGNSVFCFGQNVGQHVKGRKDNSATASKVSRGNTGEKTGFPRRFTMKVECPILGDIVRGPEKRTTEVRNEILVRTDLTTGGPPDRRTWGREKLSGNK